MNLEEAVDLNRKTCRRLRLAAHEMDSPTEPEIAIITLPEADHGDRDDTEAGALARPL